MVDQQSSGDSVEELEMPADRERIYKEILELETQSMGALLGMVEGMVQGLMKMQEQNAELVASHNKIVWAVNELVRKVAALEGDPLEDETEESA